MQFPVGWFWPFFHHNFQKQHKSLTFTTVLMGQNLPEDKQDVSFAVHIHEQVELDDMKK